MQFSRSRKLFDKDTPTYSTGLQRSYNYISEQLPTE